VGSVQKSPSSKATAIFARGTYWYYVSTEKWREHRWRLFSIDPEIIQPLLCEKGDEHTDGKRLRGAHPVHSLY
ncbi:MAG: hypothetical protein KC643_00895, partial [Nitrospira sp.]|nr:hypothetical protein [Nitrospira sp.]